MTSIDEQDAIKALAYRLTEWGIDGAHDKAKQYVGDLVSRGWTMSANVRPIRRPPTKAEECPTHVGEYRDFCRACISDRKAATDETTHPDGRWTPERIRADVRAVASSCRPTADTNNAPARAALGATEEGL